ncbi:M18 family aminopeptidase [Salinibacterium sp. dk2585]|uniref:M18 family aminopeptidase n=1 Tax=unclassified Salinibacterium TaxID=2632331 RepID=UPI0011C25752|nr:MULTISPECIES: M18 family aminopeptidase [unclassified Salinibacterium]QEE62116.1 M18 family aminopeptidase [Salinibacterium sp. dk2585]TXK53468.1 M18 family aminopeptidase [Salinibacterium sp. dk5596]
MTDAERYIADLARYIAASPSSYHAAVEAGRMLEAAGFTRLDESAAWPSKPGKRFVIRDGAIVAWVQPAGATATTPFRILGAHTDSPGFKLKPNGGTTSNGWSQASVEVYGGPLLNSWLDRELEFAGRLVTRDGREHLARTGPFARIPQLAIHLDRGVNDGLKLDKQQHVQPVFGVEADGGDMLRALADAAGVRAAEVAGFDVLTADTNPPARFGVGEKLFAAGRLDNLSSVFAGLHALLNAKPVKGHISMLAAFDHEELGSNSRSGASGPLLNDILARIGGGLKGNAEDRRRAYAESWCVSADAGHAVHPNYAERHDPNNRPIAGGGTLLKLNANQKYASDAHGSALWSRLAEAAGANVQAFVSNNTVPCGSTIGPLTATRLGIRVVDVGVPLLSMHSARELAHVDDLWALERTTGAFFAGR